MLINQNSPSQAGIFKIIDYLNLPSLIVDKKLNVYHSNDLWKKLFDNPIFEKVGEFITSDILQKLEVFVKYAYYQNDPLVDESVFLIKSINPKNSYQLLIYYYPISSKDYFIISFKSNSVSTEMLNKEIPNYIKFLSNEDEIATAITPELQDIFNSVSDLIPLSLVNRNKLKNLLDQSSQVIWLKDSNENVILANKNYFVICGMKEIDSQRTAEDYLFFAHQKDLLKNLTEYSKTTRKPIIVSGIKYSSDSVQKFPLMIYPVADKQLKNYLFFNIILKNYSDRTREIRSDIEIDEFQFPIIRIDSDKNIVKSNSAFRNLFEFSELKGIKNLTEVFNESVVDKIDEMLSSDQSEKSIFLDHSLSKTTAENCDYILWTFNPRINTNDILIYPLKAHENLKEILRQRGRMLDYYIQNSPEPIFVFDKETLKFLDINQTALNLYGYNREEFLKLDLTDLFSPEDFQSMIESLKNSNQQKITPVFKQKTKGGADVYVQLTYNDFKYNDLDCLFVIVKDVTKNLELEKENVMYKELITNSSDLIIETDSSGFIKNFNNVTISALGYDQNYLMNTSFITLVSDDDRGLTNSKLFNAQLKAKAEWNTSIKNSEGRFINAKIVSIPIKNLNNEVNHFKLIIKLEEKAKVITEFREIIKEVVVDKPVSATSSTINQNFISTEFLSGVFHEILTPLNVIFGFTQEIIEGLEKPTPEQKEAADIISQNRIKLLDTMNSVVEYSELVSNNSKLNISEISIVEIVEKAEKQAIDIANTFGIQFNLGKISSSLRIESDPEKLERIILGLIKIVCRLAQGKKIYLSTYPLDQELFLISVSDQFNSSSSYLTNSFNKLFNLQAEPRDVGAPRLTVHLIRFFMNLLKMKFVEKIKINDKTESGFLLPLKLTKAEVIEPSLSNNEIELKEFNIPEIPEVIAKESHVEPKIKKDTAPSKKIEQKDSKKLSELTCLYIEDQIDSQVLFKTQLKELKEIVVAPSYEDALPHLESRKFDFIVIDINIEGEYNGLDALKLIRKIPGYDRVPIFASTAYILPGNKERFILAGFNNFIDKPIFKETIVESLSKVLAK
jgi:PAS domain S-box-containing protein